MYNTVNGTNYCQRPLGYAESFQYILNSSCFILRNVIVMLELDRHVNIDQLVGILENLFNRFVALRLNIYEKEGIPYFINNVTFTDIPISICSDHNNIIPLKEIESEMNDAMDYNLYLWRAKYIIQTDKNYLLLTFHHSIFDGRSIIKLLKYINQNIDIRYSNKSINLYPPIESSIDLSSSVDMKFDNDEYDSVLKMRPIKRNCTLNKQKSKCLPIVLDYIDITKLKLFCRNQQLTINQLLNAITIKSISKINTMDDKLIVHTPVDLTRHSEGQSHNDEIGCFISIIKSVIKCFKDKSLLEIAKIYANETKLGFDNLKIEKTFNYHDLKRLVTTRFHSVNNHFLGGIAVSNIGELNVDVVNSIVKDVYFTTSLSGRLGIFVLSVLTINDKLNLMLSYTHPLVSDKFIEKFIDNFIAQSLEIMQDY